MKLSSSNTEIRDTFKEFSVLAKSKRNDRDRLFIKTGLYSAKNLFGGPRLATDPISVNLSCCKKRTLLAAMTNKQSLEDGRLSDDERWLYRRAKGGLGLRPAAANVTETVEDGKGNEGDHHWRDSPKWLPNNPHIVGATVSWWDASPCFSQWTTTDFSQSGYRTIDGGTSYPRNVGRRKR